MHGWCGGTGGQGGRDGLARCGVWPPPRVPEPRGGKGRRAARPLPSVLALTRTQNPSLVFQPRPCQEELRAAKVPLGDRDYCAHLLIPLNECRRKSLYMPWACGAQRHAYEKCLYFDYKARAAAKTAEKEG